VELRDPISHRIGNNMISQAIAGGVRRAQIMAENGRHTVDETSHRRCGLVFIFPIIISKFCDIHN